MNFLAFSYDHASFAVYRAIEDCGHIAGRASARKIEGHQIAIDPRIRGATGRNWRVKQPEICFRLATELARHQTQISLPAKQASDVTDL